MQKNIYNYHPITREYLNQGLADPDPLEPGNFLLPAHSTEIAPPNISAYEIAVYLVDEWVIMADHRGETWYLPNREPVEIKEIGVSPEQDWTLEPSALTLTELIKAKLKEINVVFEKSMSLVVTGYPEKEISSWAKQESEARAYVASNSASTPLIDALSTARNLPKAELVTRIIAKADLFAGVSGQLIGYRQSLEDQLNSLPQTATAEDVEAIVWKL